MTQEAIGKFIAKCREEQKLTQGALGDKLGVNGKKVAAWEEGHAMPNMELFEPLCRVLDINVSELLAAKKLKDADKVERGEKVASAVFAAKFQVMILSIISIALIVVGVIMAIVLPTFMPLPGNKVVGYIACALVAAFGIVFRVFLGKITQRLEKE